MPIRINLLAEQQAAEEARRRDPVKRALWAAGGVIALVLIWVLNLQLKLSGAKSELTAQEANWKKSEPAFLQVSNSYRETGQISKRLTALQRHATNRFLWTHPLSALQHAADERVRVVSLATTSVSSEQKQIIVSTNKVFDLPPRPWWKWTAEPLQTNVEEVARTVLSSITNRADLIRYQPELISTFTISTNRIQVVVKIDVIKPETVTENVAMSIRARDYGKPPGSRVDAFYASITNAPFLKLFSGRTNITVQPDTIQPREDESDKISPGEPYIPFTVQFNFPERIRANE